MDKDDGLTMVYHLPPCPMFMVLQGTTAGPQTYAQHPAKQAPHCETLSSIIKQIHEICQKTTFLVTNIYEG